MMPGRWRELWDELEMEVLGVDITSESKQDCRQSIAFWAWNVTTVQDTKGNVARSAALLHYRSEDSSRTFRAAHRNTHSRSS